MSVVRRTGMAFVRVALGIQIWLYRRTDGRRAGSMRGMPVLLLTTTGRKSGQDRTVPIGYLPTDDGLLVCGSNNGSDRSPAWALNLRARPVASVRVKADTYEATVTELSDVRYDERWTAFVAAYPGFAAYRKKTTRHLPLFLLTRATAVA